MTNSSLSEEDKKLAPILAGVICALFGVVFGLMALNATAHIPEATDLQTVSPEKIKFRLVEDTGGRRGFGFREKAIEISWPRDQWPGGDITYFYRERSGGFAEVLAALEQDPAHISFLVGTADWQEGKASTWDRQGIYGLEIAGLVRTPTEIRQESIWRWRRRYGLLSVFMIGVAVWAFVRRPRLPEKRAAIPD